MRIVLIIPPGGYYAERWQKGALMPSLGVGYIASSLEQEEHEVHIIDAHVENLPWRRLEGMLKKISPSVVGFSFTTENRFEAFRLIEQVKKAFPQVTTIAGGPHVTPTATDTLKNISALDLIVRGEGEATMVELGRCLEEGKDYGEVLGLSYRRNGEVKNNPRRHFIENLDSIPFPAWHLMPWYKYNFILEVPEKGKVKHANLITSRGCPFSCNFCATQNSWGRRFRARSPENVLREIRQLVDNYGVKGIWFFDDTFTTNRQRVWDICQGLIEAKLDLSWFCEIRVDTVDKELLQKMKESGCYCVAFGVESGSQRILDEVIGKKISLQQVREVTRWCYELGIKTNPFFIFSHPEETEEDIEQTMEMMRNWPAHSDISLSLLHIYPGTRLEAAAKEKGLLPADFSWAKKDQRGVITLPSAQGNVPIFVDKLSWEYLSRLMFEWAEGQRYRILNKIPRAIRSIRTYSDFKRYMTMFKTFIKVKFHKLLSHGSASSR